MSSYQIHGDLQPECEQALASKSQIDRIGKRLLAIEKSSETERDIACYRKFRLSSFADCISRVMTAELPNHSYLSARLKRLVSIKRKLIRSKLSSGSMQLSQVDDILGIRIVCDVFSQAQDFSERLKKASNHWKIKNYVEKPQTTGYRAIHHIFKVDQQLPNGNNATFTFEVQVRTVYQNDWGNWSESYGEQAKEGNASKEIKSKLLQLSREVYSWETQHERERQGNIPEASKEHNFVIVRRIKGQSTAIYPFLPGDWKVAIDYLLKLERYRSGNVDALLCAVGGEYKVDEMKKRLELTHPTFFRKVYLPEKWQPTTH